MDTRFLNFHGGEQFSTFGSTYFLDPSGDESQTSEDTNNPRCSWDWDRERELNGDIGLIPITNNTNGDFCVLSTSPPSKEDFHKIMCDWQQLVNVELEDIEELTEGMLGDNSEHSEFKKESSSENLSESILVFSDSGSSHVDSARESMCNVVEQNSDSETGPSLKSGDAENVRNENMKKDFSTHTFKKRQISYGGKKIDMKNQRYVLDSDSDEDSHVDVETLSDISSSEKNCAELAEDILPDEHQINNLPVPSEVPAVSSYELSKETAPAPNIINLVQGQQTLLGDNYNDESGESSFCATSLNESGYWNSPENELSPQALPNTEEKSSPVIEAGDLNSLLEQFEAKEYETQQNHDDCSTKNIMENKKVSPPKTPKAIPFELTKYVSQTTTKRKSRILIKTASSKARESVLSFSYNLVNLDHNYCASSSSIKDSDLSSCDEDDRTVLHSQPTVKTADGKLMVSLLKINTIKKRKLNLEEYKQLRKDRRSNYAPSAYRDENARRLKKMCVQPLPLPTPNIEIKTLVSIGVNTDQSWGRLQELVNGCQEVNFGINSFITSLVEHLPKNECVELGEDKTIVYLDKDRAEPPKTANKSSQTSFEERSPSRSSSCSSRSSRSSSKSPSPRKRRNSTERMREVEERRVIYVGRIGDFMTRDDLRRRFERFGPITNVSAHFRKTGDNYGFVTFKHRQDAYEAVEHGNDDINLPQYDLSFGGRRMFCQTSYSDLDNVQDEETYPLSQASEGDTFDVLLREVKAKLMRNKKEF